MHHIFRVVYTLARYVYRILKLFFRPLVHIHPRVHRFGIAIREAVKELIRPPELTPNTIFEPSQDVTPQPIEERIQEGNEEHPHEEEKEAPIPTWLIDEWREIHLIEPQVFPEKRLIENIPFYHIPTSRIAEPYLELCKFYGDNISHVFLVPWIERGGADIVTINYIQALLDFKPNTGIVVIATSNSDSPWANKLPAKVRFVEFGKKYSQLSEDEQEKLLTKLLIQMAPKVIHNINSDLGYRIFVRYGNALNSVSNLYASFFCTDITQEGKFVGYAYNYLAKCFDYLKAVYFDNQSFLNRLTEVYAFDKEKMHLHYQPIQIANKRINYVNIVKKKHMDIIWAGRIDRQKRPDILIKIAQASQDLPFKFHVYGISVLDDDLFTNKFMKQNNITYYGVFDKLNSLPTEKYDLFLYTSQWDGMPTILLDAISLGLPVIASNVGGISELIHHEKTGFLIDPFDDVNQYVNCLQKIYNHRSALTTIVKNAYELIVSRHSWNVFNETVKNVPYYCV